jgi:hypothetical protein
MQHRCVKNERALSNGLSDVGLTTVTALKPPISPSMFNELPIVGVWLRSRSDHLHPGEKQKRTWKRLSLDRACSVLVVLLISFFILSKSLPLGSNIIPH